MIGVKVEYIYCIPIIHDDLMDVVVLDLCCDDQGIVMRMMYTTNVRRYEHNVLTFFF